jgi:benzoyl-CoA-dihydrodiol lyase
VSASQPVDFETDPSRYRHWRLAIDPPVATLVLEVDPTGGLDPDCELKLNSYDLSVDIELHDAVQRLRFEHPEVRAVVVTGGMNKVFCAGANIQMLAGASHHHKVNFCKFTNETRNAIEDATAHSGQAWIAAVNGTAAGGGYELALACDEIVLIDDRASAISLPEVPLLAVLPGTGGLTRVVDKRHVRRDLADVFATRTEGVKGQQAVDWGLVDLLVPKTRFDEVVRSRAEARAAVSDRPGSAAAVVLESLTWTDDGDERHYGDVDVQIDHTIGAAFIIVHGPDGDDTWVLRTCRQLDHAILHLRFNEPEIGTWVLRTMGNAADVLAVDDAMRERADDWLTREIRLYWARTLRRLELSARTIVALVEPGSCFAGTLAELALAADRTMMLDGTWPDDDRPAATLTVTDANDGWYPMTNRLSRLAARFWGRADELAVARSVLGKALLASEAADAGLVTFTPDDIDWDDELRLFLEERNSFSPDALTAMEANFRFAGPETMESKIFARLSAWQNWIFQRPNAVGPDGALHRFGTGSRPVYDRKRV